MTRRVARLVGSGSLLGALLASHVALALNQPDGAAIPSNQALKAVLDAQGESIDPAKSAATTPETFDPSCELTFTVLARGGGQKNSFGWYNATGAKPAPDDLHEFLGCDDGVGTVKKLNITSDPAYKGGKVGFFMATTEGKPGNCVKFGPGGPQPDTLGFMYYSENQYNDDNASSKGFIHLVVLDSGVYPKAFYFGWEDLFGGGDNDFEDLLTRVQGITCAGGGDPCDTMQPGVCAAGVTQCREGKLQCVGQSAPTSEVCNRLDDDCNGKVDDGQVCPPGEVCFEGACVGKCGSGEFVCPGALVCDTASGFCVDPACKGKTCPEGAVCRAGACVAPCQGVTCPAGQVCRLDVCVDPCDGLSCDQGSVCDAGVCRESCSCGGCPAGAACLADGRCVEASCAEVMCGVGEVCKGGACIDACAGAVCPGGKVCSMGACVAAPGAGGAAGAGGATVGVGGAGAAASAGMTNAGGSGGKGGATAGVGGGAGKGGAAGKPSVKTNSPVDATVEGPSSAACVCGVPGRGVARGGLVGVGAWSAALAVLAARGRRRARGRGERARGATSR